MLAGQVSARQLRSNITHVGAALVVIAVCGCRPMTAPVPPPPQPITMAALHQAGGVPPGWRFSPPPGDAAAGRRAFVDLGCYTCHDIQGERFPQVSVGDKRPGPDLTGMGSHHPPEYFTESILNPNSVLVDGPGYLGADERSIMPAYPDMTLAQLADLVAYLQSLTTGGDASLHAQHRMAPTPPGGVAPNIAEAAVYLVEVTEVTSQHLKAFDVWFGETGMEDLKAFTGFVSLQTFVNRSAGQRQLVTIFGFEDETALQDFLTQAQAPEAPAEIRAVVRPGKGAVFRSAMLLKAVGLSLP
jgi:hypothetical protein